MVLPVERVTQDAEQLEADDSDECWAQRVAAGCQIAQGVAGVFVAAFVAVEPVFQIVLLVVVMLDEAEGVEVFRFEVVFDVDAVNLALRRALEAAARPLVDVAVLRADVEVEGVLPLLGLRDVVVRTGGVGDEEGVGFFRAVGRLALAEDKGLFHSWRVSDGHLFRRPLLGGRTYSPSSSP